MKILSYGKSDDHIAELTYSIWLNGFTMPIDPVIREKNGKCLIIDRSNYRSFDISASEFELVRNRTNTIFDSSVKRLLDHDIKKI